MKRLNQDGAFDHVLYAGAVVIAASMFIFLYFYWQNTQDTRMDSDSGYTLDEKPESELRTPNDWLKYTNATINYSFVYPQSWGRVLSEKQELSSTVVNYTYRFSKKDTVVVSQNHLATEELDFTGSYLIFNRFSVDDSTVTICTGEKCKKGYSAPTKNIRLFTNENGREGIDFFDKYEDVIRLNGLAETGKDNYPGIVIEARFKRPKGKFESVEDIVDQVKIDNYVEIAEIREFLEVLR